jgi:diamine N-acetyltransferase
VELVHQNYSEAGYPFAEHEVRAALVRLFAEPERGQVWVIEWQDRLEGYAILTLGFSLEYGGLDAFIDELFLTPEHRGLGLGQQALVLLEQDSVRRGVRALHLEVERDKIEAQELYRKWGFIDHQRYLLTKRLTTPSAKRDEA